MRIKKLFKTEKDYLDYAWSLINFDGKIWKDEDLPKLKAFFSHKEGQKLTPEIKESFEYYKKCCIEYSNELTEIKDSLRNFNSEDLYEFFFLNDPIMNAWDTDEDGNDLDEGGNIIPPNDRNALKIEYSKFDIKFPMVFVGWIESGFSRAGDESVMFSEFVNID